MFSVCRRTAGQFHDELLLREKLERESKRVFSSDESVIEVIIQHGYEGKPPAITTTIVTDVSKLQHVLSNRGKYTVIIIRQRNTWSKLRSRFELTEALATIFDVFPPFWDMLLAFGFRCNDIGDDFQGYNHRTKSILKEGKEEKVQETCFNIRFPECNGRPNGDPWSIRHSALYHQYQSHADSHIWVIVQPSERFGARIHDLLKVSALGDPIEQLLNAECFLSSSRSWREYIVHLQQTLTVLEHQALFSKAHTSTKPDFNVSFSNSQEAQRLRKRLLQSQFVLTSTIATIQEYLVDYADHGPCDDALRGDLFRLHAHKRVTVRIIQQLDGIFQVLLEILKCRNDDALRATTDAIYQNGRDISKLITASASQNQAIAALTQKTQKDSNMVKIFSIVAFLYLPATLVASVFNSNLVDTVTIVGASESRFRLASQFWMFPVFTIGLTIFSLLSTTPWILSRRNPGAQTATCPARI